MKIRYYNSQWSNIAVIDIKTDDKDYFYRLTICKHHDNEDYLFLNATIWHKNMYTIYSNDILSYQCDIYKSIEENIKAAVKHFRKIIDRVIDCINYQARLQSGFNIHFTAKTGKRKAISI